MTTQQIAALRQKAAALDSKIAHYFRDRLTNTRKRALEDEGMRRDGRKFQSIQGVMRTMADKHEAGTAPVELAAWRHVSEFQEGVGFVLSMERGAAEYPQSAAAYRDRYNAGHLAILDILRELPSNPFHESDSDKAHRIERDLKLRKIPGFFPTRLALVNRMVGLAELASDMRVLEPSAGSGAIADAARAAGAKVDVIEINGSLRELLALKGHTLLPERDFLELDPTPVYDRVLMNPPFENFQDIDHVAQAYKFLKASGLLVAIVSPGVFFRDNSKALEFREWFEEMDGTVEDLPAGSFEMTGCSGKLIVVRKPDAAIPLATRSLSAYTEDANKGDKMRFTIHRRELVTELTLLNRVVEKKTTIPILNHVLIEARPEGFVKLTGTDLELSLTAELDAIVAPDCGGGVAVPARTLLEALKKLPGELVDVSADEAHQITVASGRVQFKLAGLWKDSFPEPPTVPAPAFQTFAIDAADLAEMIERTSFAISAEESRFTLNGALLEINGACKMIATDGHRLSYAEFPGRTMEEGENMHVIIPRKALDLVPLLNAASGKVVSIATDERIGEDSKGKTTKEYPNVFFSVGRRILTARRLTGNFPDYDNEDKVDFGLGNATKAGRGAMTFDPVGRLASGLRVRYILMPIQAGIVEEQPAQKALLAKEMAITIEEAAPNYAASIKENTEAAVQNGTAIGIVGAPSVEPAIAASRDARLPAADTVLTREFRGAQIRVTVLDTGFAYDGRVFGSLSAIAKLATGGNRNGFTFFGLRAS